jgi:hypothetical protein
MKFITALSILSLATALLGCTKHHIEGNHDVVIQTFDMADLTEVTNDDIFRVIIIKDSVSKIVVEAESNLIPYIEMRNIGGKELELSTHEDLDPNEPIYIYVHMKSMERLSMNGSGSLEATEFDSPLVYLDINGSGHLHYTGQAEQLYASINGSGSCYIDSYAQKISGDISGSGSIEWIGTAVKAGYHIDGSGDIRALEMDVDSAYTTTEGSGDIYVNAKDYLHSEISGSGDVYYLGSPVVEAHVSGSGHVVRYGK